MLLQLLLVFSLWLTQGEARPSGAKHSKSACWFGRDNAYKDGEVVRSYQMYCTAVVCRGDRIVLEPMQNCTCLEISGLELARTGVKWQTLEDNSSDEEEQQEERQKREEAEDYDDEADEVGSEEGEEYDYETEEGGGDEWDGYDYGAEQRQGKQKEGREEEDEEYDYEQEDEEGEDYGSEEDTDLMPVPRLPIKRLGRQLVPDAQPGYPAGAMTLHAGAPVVNQLPGGLSAKDLRKRKYRCRLNGWFPRLTDGTLQTLDQKCVRLVCSAERNGKIGLQIQARTGCTCSSG